MPPRTVPMRTSFLCGVITGCAVVATMQLVLVKAQLPILASDVSKPLCESECSPSDRQRPVCGTDGRTYESRCDLQRARCQGSPISIQHRGKCSDNNGRCRAQRALAQQQAKEKTTDVFIPECKDDGSYAEVQCHSFTGYCWCVDDAGTPIRGSSVHHKRPNCSQQGRRSNKRRSSGRKQRKGCTTTEDRSAFNTNLIDIFRSEYKRIPSSTTQASTSDHFLDSEDRRVIQWKFTQLDTSGDNLLQRKEVRDLRRMVKKIVKPRPCAKLFIKYCDLDHDKKVSRSEWSVCLGVDIDSEQVHKAPPGLEDSNAPFPELDSDPWDRRAVPSLTGDDNEQDTSTEVKDEVEFQDCTTAQRIAMESHKQDPSGGIFIPDCSIDGLYQEAQCHKSAGYCWCVNPKNGKPIRGTTTNQVKPNCEEAKKSARAFKGCSLKKKEKFLAELIDSFSEEMRESISNASHIVEEITKWKFSRLDGNGNKVLDRKEWRDFRKEWKGFQSDSKSFKKLRKCWRNFLRFCDANGDKRVMLDEWLGCTGVKREATRPPHPKRHGPNPFSTILKSD